MTAIIMKKTDMCIMRPRDYCVMRFSMSRMRDMLIPYS